MSGSDSTLQTVSPGPLQATGDALRERLRLVFPERRFQHAVMPPRATKQDWARLLRRTPFVGLGWAEISPVRETPRAFVGTSAWTVYLVTRNVAGSRQLYWGDAQGAGLFDLVHAATAVLHGHTVPGVGTVFVRKGGNAFAESWDSDDLAMAAIDLEVGLTIDLADAVTGVPENVLATLGITWTFGPTGATELTDLIQTGATLTP